MAKPRGRPKGSGYAIDYQKVKALAGLQALQKEIAREIGMTENAFNRRLNADSKLKEALETGKNIGRLRARQVMAAAIEDHYFTFCENPDCLAITDDSAKFYPICPKCKSEGEDERHNPVRHKVKHRREPGDRETLRFYAKNFLEMSDKVTIQGDEEKPVVIATLADAALARAKRKKEQAAKARAEVAKAEQANEEKE